MNTAQLLKWLLPLTLVIATVVALLFGLNRDVRVVQVDGDLSKAERQEIIASASAVVAGSGLLTVDIEALQRKLYALSWPRSVTVRRVWPQTLSLAVTKESVIARWSDDRYLTSAGKVVVLPQKVSGLPLLSCEVATPRAAMEMYRALVEFAAVARLTIEGLEQNELGEWQVQFAGGLQVKLGANDVQSRMERFVFTYNERLAALDSQILVVDARYAHGLAVRFAEEQLTDTNKTPMLPLAVADHVTRDGNVGVR